MKDLGYLCGKVYHVWDNWHLSKRTSKNNRNMCKMNDVQVGIKKLDFTNYRGKMSASLTDGRKIIVPLSFFPDIRKLNLKQRNEWMILDEQFFTFDHLSKIYSVTDLMKVS